jgi:hypothetical protein
VGSWNRVWIFFVIVAVGLVLSWGQVGRKAEQRLGADPSRLLQTESPCQPQHAPCAASGAAFALVLGPDGPRALQLRAVGEPRPELSEVRVRGAGRAAAEWRLVAEPLGPAAWRLPLPEEAASAGVEVQVRLARPAVAALFPLGRGAGQ